MLSRLLQYDFLRIGFSASSRFSSTYILRTPPAYAPREVPTPLVFLSASEWDEKSQHGMRTFASMFAERGYTSLEIDIALPQNHAQSTSEVLMQHMESELLSHVRLCGIPFPPVIFARAAGSLIAQTYISSHPASGLLLISPATSNKTVPSSLLPTPLREFDFEPQFPCGIMCTQQETGLLAKENRLWQDSNVDKLVVKDERSITRQEGFVKIEQWLDEIGI
ncbi:hypothetical protein B0H21DRAFT_772112 [Amylocystis lapponica]|nr:hypothetical protein B0H21DRAFT_772112 [Amylocystis lapponica]